MGSKRKELPLIMRTHAKHTTILLCAATLALAGASVVRAADEGLDEATKARIAKAEQGPATIDVLKYPQPIQDNYEVFSQKCTQCHKLSRPINSDYCLPAEWERYVKRMMHKPGSGINATDGKKIFDFLVYDSSVRKKAQIDEKLAKATADEKAAAEKKIKEIRDKYDQ
jgi:cytochrome c5